MIPEHGVCSGFVAGQPWVEGRDCYLCWSAANHERYKVLFKTWKPRRWLRSILLRSRYVRFALAIIRYLTHGLPRCSPADRAARWEKCEPCEYNRDGACGKCGCGVSPDARRVLNKVAWASESCPEKKWGPVRGEKVWTRAGRWIKEMLWQ